MTDARVGRMSDWTIRLEPVAAGEGGDIAWVSGDERDAITELEYWADVLNALGYVPTSTVDWRNETMIHVGRRIGKRRYRVRCDAFERETESGVSAGAGWLYVREELAR